MRIIHVDRNEIKKWVDHYFLGRFFDLEDDEDFLKVRDFKNYLRFKDDDMGLLAWLEIKSQDKNP